MNTVLMKLLVSGVIDSESNTQKIVQFQKEYLPEKWVEQQSLAFTQRDQRVSGARPTAPCSGRAGWSTQGWLQWQQQLSSTPFFYFCKILDSELFELMHQNGDYTHFYFCYRWFLLDFKRGKRCGMHGGAS